MFGLQTKWENIIDIQTDRTHRKHVILLTPMHKYDCSLGKYIFD